VCWVLWLRDSALRLRRPRHTPGRFLDHEHLAQSVTYRLRSRPYISAGLVAFQSDCVDHLLARSLFHAFYFSVVARVAMHSRSHGRVLNVVLQHVVSDKVLSPPGELIQARLKHPCAHIIPQSNIAWSTLSEWRKKDQTCIPSRWRQELSFPRSKNKALSNLSRIRWAFQKKAARDLKRPILIFPTATHTGPQSRYISMVCAESATMMASTSTLDPVRIRRRRLCSVPPKKLSISPLTSGRGL